jgi:cyclin H
MDFDRSSQAKSWLFDEQSLQACRAQSTAPHEVDVRKPRVKTVRKFASGFHRSAASQSFNPCTEDLLDPEEQESLIRFHAHQMQTLVGPTALLPELRTSITVLSTAIMLFRRFYLSNSILYFNPRKMAAACAFFAAKSEEEKIEVSHHGRVEMNESL